MNKLLLLIVTSVFICSCKQTRSITSNNPNQLEKTDTSSYYRVNQINTINSIEGSSKNKVYIINLQRNDSIFRVYSKKQLVLPVNTNDRKIKVGNKYKFNLKPIYIKEELVNSRLFPVNYLDVRYTVGFEDVYFIADWDYFINSYTTNNLFDLYYKP